MWLVSIIGLYTDIAQLVVLVLRGKNWLLRNTGTHSTVFHPRTSDTLSELCLIKLRLAVWCSDECLSGRFSLSLCRGDIKAFIITALMQLLKNALLSMSTDSSVQEVKRHEYFIRRSINRKYDQHPPDLLFNAKETNWFSFDTAAQELEQVVW